MKSVRCVHLHYNSTIRKTDSVSSTTDQGHTTSLRGKLKGFAFRSRRRNCKLLVCSVPWDRQLLAGCCWHRHSNHAIPNEDQNNKMEKKNEDQLKTNYLVATVTFVSSTKLNRISLRLWWKPQKCPIKMPTDKNTMRLFYCGFMHVMHERAHWYKHILVKYLLVSLA